MITHWEIIFQLLLAALLGGLVGLERERISWYAGLRTHMLVCIGSTLVMIVSQHGFDNIIRPGLVVLDPSRIAAQVVSGIGFLGAGTILFWKNKIKGLTTAASLWSVGAVGLAIGGTLYFAAIIATIFIVIILAVLKPFEKMLFGALLFKEMKLHIGKDFSLTSLSNLLKNAGLSSINISMEKEIIDLTIEYNSEPTLLELADKLRKLPNVDSIEISE